MGAPFDRDNAIASEAAAREMVGRLAGIAAAAVLNDSAPAAVAEAFVRTRVVRPRGALYGADGDDLKRDSPTQGCPETISALIVSC
jgi:hypothetical protein